MLDYPDDDMAWNTTASHPYSGTAYQEVVFDNRVWGRITVNGDEVVTPSRNTDRVYAQYQGRVSRSIQEMEDALGARETQADRDAWYDTDR